MHDSILLIGAAHPDRLSRITGAFVPGASNPGTTSESVGGGAYNAAVALRAFGSPVRFLGVRGGDEAGGRVAAALAEIGVTDGSVTWLDRRTPSYSAILDGNGELIAGVADMALYELLGPRLLRRRHIRQTIEAACAILLDANLPEAATAALARDHRGTPMAGIGVSPAKVKRLTPLLQHFEALFVSRLEAAQLTELDPATPPEALAAGLAELGIRRAAITSGSGDAAILADDAITLQAPPHVASVRDVTGAGDTLAAIAFLGLREGLPFPAAVRLGMSAAARRISAGLEPGCRRSCEATAADLPPARIVSPRS